MYKSIFIISILFSSNLFAQNAYMCKVNGVTKFSQTPCGDKVKKVNVKRQKSNTAPNRNYKSKPIPSTKKTPQQEMDEIRVSQLQRKIKTKERKIDSLTRKMEREIDALKAEQLRANNNLAGAVYRESLSQDMVAVSSKYSTLIKKEQANIESIKRDKTELENKLKGY